MCQMQAMGLGGGEYELSRKILTKNVMGCLEWIWRSFEYIKDGEELKPEWFNNPP